jgi:Holliday junction DNA helicase RuvA
MIATLAGVVAQIEADAAVIDVNGVGYLAFCSTRTIGRLPPPGSPARLLIETHVREDHIHLYGFIDTAERDWFRLLTTVQGVGARLALSLLSAVPPEKLGIAILAQDKPALAQADGVGPRLAARIANELRDKIGNLAASASAVSASAVSGALLNKPMNGEGATADAIAALENLGVGRSEAFGAIAAAARRLGSEAAADVLIKAGLEELAR